MAGSVMILLKLENKKYYLHTGDMRFNYAMLENTSGLFDKNFENEENPYFCKYEIDELYLDNTYCDPIFQFPNRVIFS